MKILIVSSFDTHGGAALAAFRLHKSLLAEDVDSQMLVQSKTSACFKVTAEDGKFRKLMAKMRPTLDQMPTRKYKNRTQGLFSPASVPFSGISNKINSLKPDLVHLHWIAAGMVSVEELAKIEAPILWSLHDMWAFTGGCHYDQECGGYKDSCGNCKVLGSEKRSDLSKKVFLRKEKTYKKIENLAINGSSQWLVNSIKDSSLLAGRSVSNLPNPIDYDIFKPIDQSISRDLFKINTPNKLILFGAIAPLGEPRKGFEPLSVALKKIRLDKLELVVAGIDRPENDPFPLATHYIPPVRDEVSLALMYNVANVFVAPSLQENLANSIVESLLCGVPVVAFNIGGNSDLIVHKKTGYLVEPFDTDDLSRGIEWIIQNPDGLDFEQECRNHMLDNFNKDKITRDYIALYKEILG